MIIKSGNGPFYSCGLSTLEGLSLSAEGQGFPPATNNVAPSYFHRKIEKK